MAAEWGEREEAICPSNIETRVRSRRRHPERVVTSRASRAQEQGRSRQGWVGDGIDVAHAIVGVPVHGSGVSAGGAPRAGGGRHCRPRGREQSMKVLVALIAKQR